MKEFYGGLLSFCCDPNSYKLGGLNILFCRRMVQGQNTCLTHVRPQVLHLGHFKQTNKPAPELPLLPPDCGGGAWSLSLAEMRA